MDRKSRFKQLMRGFYESYAKALKIPAEPLLPQIELFTQEALIQIKKPFSFEPYHKKIRSPVDYYQLGLDVVSPLIDKPHSYMIGPIEQISEQLKRKENIILLANHQTEADPQIMSILFQDRAPHLADKTIYVAGERVVTDPLAIPFSMGCDLLCIYSKRYIDHPPELKAQKLLHNRNTMEQLRQLLHIGGKMIYVAPSGGRDRKDANGIPQVAPFDPNSVEMIYLMARKAGTPTHFYPTALATYNIFPPPETVQTELGEERHVNRAPARISFSEEFDMEKFPGSEENDKQIRRQSRATAIWRIVHDMHEKIR